MQAQMCRAAIKRGYDISPNRLVRVFRDDDAPFTDHYYTQGTRIEIITPNLHRPLPMRALLGLNKRPRRYYGITVSHGLYTPDSIHTPAIVQGDHPYAGYLTLGAQLICNDYKRNMRLTSRMEAGLLGKVASGQFLHSNPTLLLGRDGPQGWDNQLKTDLMLLYGVRLDKGLLTVPGLLELFAHGIAEVGTQRTQAGIGVDMRIGSFMPYFHNLDLSYKSHVKDDAWPTRDWQLYGLASVDASYWLRDAVLQGGMFIRNSPYRLRGKEMEHPRLYARAGFGASWRRWGMELYETFQTRTFSSGENYFYGTLRITHQF